ncbi:DUF2158 domain-containing protein [Pseudoduganella eburnea]|uniref:DUF2158 domain-containing protein n=1 Tax=Massilia eburnea TaxID=1776165 RepID=A0A6L6QHP3_9BURK|nr:DUF2158 domain-containing protein [Massilia eburnea]MTW11417.1 DUF2158 domain-containing protein [Massilia eburnea]
MATFEKGVVVKLKSGGPKMTVVGVGDYGPIGPEDGVQCTWFDEKNKLQSQTFDAAVLELV